MRGTFGEWLKAARKAAGKTQTDAGEAIGKLQGVMSDIERGMNHNLTRTEVKALAEWLGASVDEALVAAGFFTLPVDADPSTKRLIDAWTTFSREQRAALLTIIDSMKAA